MLNRVSVTHTLGPSNHHLADEDRLPNAGLRDALMERAAAWLTLLVDGVMLVKLEVLSHSNESPDGHP